MNLLEKLNRKETIIDSEYQYLRLWLKENDLIESKRFVCWNSSKSPINAKSGNKASLIDSDDWNTFDYCLSFAQSHKDIIKGVIRNSIVVENKILKVENKKICCKCKEIFTFKKESEIRCKKCESEKFKLYRSKNLEKERKRSLENNRKRKENK